MKVFNKKAKYSLGEDVLYEGGVYQVVDVDDNDHATRLVCTHFEDDGTHCKNCTAEILGVDEDEDGMMITQWGDGFTDKEVIEL